MDKNEMNYYYYRHFWCVITVDFNNLCHFGGASLNFGDCNTEV